MKTGRKKAVLFAGLFLSLLLFALPTPARAAGAEPVTAIGSAQALDAFALSVRQGQTYAGQTVILTADIDMTGRAFTAVGVTAGDDASRVFQGTFDGAGHTITGLSVSAAPGSDGAGFFSGLYNATVRDLTLDVTLSADGADAVGGLAGRAVDAAISRVEMNVYLTAASWPVPRDGILAAGGLVGLAEGRTVIDRCAVQGYLGAAGAFAGDVYAGGLLGCVRSGGSDGRVTNCYATAMLYVNDRGLCVGGLAGGFVGDGGYTVLENCYAAASMVIGEGNAAGGFFGAADGSVMVGNAWYDADLAAGLDAGGSGSRTGLGGAPTARMQSGGFPDVLGSAFAPDSQGRNGGYPILDFQAPAAPTAAPVPTGTPTASTSPPAGPVTAPPAPSAAPTGTAPLPTAMPWPTSPPLPPATPRPSREPFVPQTGDSTAIFPWLALFGLSGAALTWLARRPRL